MRIGNSSGLLLTWLATLCAAGCATQHPVESTVAELPPHAYEQSAQDAIMALPLFKRHPEMAHYVGIGNPVPAYQTSMPLLGGKVVWKGYMVEINYNVTNFFGVSHAATRYVLYDGDNVHDVVGDYSEAGVHLL
jgi:hypothetical protein